MSSAMMKAISLSGLGGLEKLVPSEVPVPQVGPDDILVKVQAVSINPVEAKFRGGYWENSNVHTGAILGFDSAGTVHSIGSAVPEGTFKIGDEVYLMGSKVPGGSNAEYVLADYRVVAPKPKTLSFEDASAFPLVGITAWELFEQLRLGEEPGAILIINGAGGLGSIVTQLARHIYGLSTVIATASREISINHTKLLGATHVISHREPLKPQIDALGLDVPIKYIVVLSAITKSVLDQAIDIIAPWGKIGLVTPGPPESYEGLSAGQVKGISVQWTLVFTKIIFNWKLETQGEALRRIASFIDEGKIKSITTQRLDLTVEGLRRAHELMESGETTGKVVLKVPAQGGFR